MFFSNAVMFFIIALAQHALCTRHGKHCHRCRCGRCAAAARGRWCLLPLALGIIGTGLLAIPVLAGSTSYAISESFGWKHGLYRKLKEAYAFMASLLSRCCSHHTQLYRPRSYQSAHLLRRGQRLVAPVVLVLIVLMSSDKKSWRSMLTIL